MEHTKLLKFGILIFMLIIGLGIISQPKTQTVAQDDGVDACITMVVKALQMVGTACAEIGRNEACYGHNSLDATFNTETPPRFDESGDLTGVGQLESLITQPLDLNTGEWGVGVMLLQADLPEDNDSAMTLVLMGDTQLDSVTNDAESSASQQTFTLQTSPSGDCGSVPDGLLIRSPEGQRARVTVNGVELVFSSAGYLTTPSDKLLSIQGLEGEIEVTADGQTETIMPDFYTTIPLDNLQADGPPSLPQPIAEEQTLLLTAFDVATVALIDNEIGSQTFATTNMTGTVNMHGVWRNIDMGDGSSQLLNLHSNRGIYVDFGASTCGVDAGGIPLWAIIGHASTISYTDTQTTATFNFRCLGGTVEPFSIELIFTVVDMNTLEDNIGEIWRR
jgi:hypothetical protein